MIIRAGIKWLLAVFLVFAVSSAGEATPLDVPLAPYPSIIAGFITSGYNATTGAFSATGWALTLDLGTGPKQNITTTFKLLATIENTGVAKNATLTIGPAASPLLFSNSLIDFDYAHVQGGSLEFLFSSPIGSYTTGVNPIYDPSEPLDVMFTGMGTAFPGAFTSNWSSSSNTAEIREDPATPAVPEPSTLLLMLVGAGGVYQQARKRPQRARA